jgi:hypothetical protein
MARKNKPAPLRPGFEPAMGRPDPLAPPPPPVALTHYPHPSGTVCGVYPQPTYAGDYDPVEPTCPKCLGWLRATQAVTAARYGAPQAPPTPPTDTEDERE